MGIRALIGLIAAASLLSPLAWADESPPPAKAAARAFRELGLSPAGERGFIQPIRYKEQSVLLDRSSASVRGAAAPVSLMIGRDLILDLDARQPRSVTAPLAFVGYGLPSVQGRRDDFAGQDLKGKVAVYIDATPLYLSDDQAHTARALARAAAERAGALGLVAIDVSPSAWTARLSRWTGSGRYLADAPLQPTRDAQLVAALAPQAAERVFAASGVDLATLLAAARAGRPLASLPLAGELETVVELRTRTGVAEAVLARSAGVDRYLSRNSVIVSAANGDSAALTGLVRALGDAKRSLVFALLPADLPEAQAAKAVADRLGVGREAVVAAIHLDSAGSDLVELTGAAESSLGDDALAVAATLGVRVAASARQTAMIGFALAGTPAITFAGQGSEQCMAALTKAVADRAVRPAWKLTSPFAPPAPRAQEHLTAPLEMPVGKRPQKILPSYGALQRASSSKAA